jgi:hypothetical protein
MTRLRRDESDFAIVRGVISILVKGHFSVKRKALEAYERIALKTIDDPEFRREARRRIAEDLLNAATEVDWVTASPFLGRLKRRGFSGPDRIVLAASWIARLAHRSEEARREVGALLARAERELLRGPYTRAYREREFAYIAQIRSQLGTLS